MRYKPLLFLGVFAKLRTATASFVVTARPSVYLSEWNDSAPTGRIFHLIYDEFSKICTGNSRFIKSDKINE
jgi:hypothetical protein